MRTRAIQLFLSLGVAATVAACGGATDDVQEPDDAAGDATEEVEETDEVEEAEDNEDDDEGGEGGEGGEG